MATPPKPSPPREPSLFAYQTRLLDSPTTPSSRHLSSRANSPPVGTPSTPSRLSRMGSITKMPDAAVGELRHSASGARIGLGLQHGRGKSVDLVRGQWEAKINEAAAAGAADGAPSTPRSSRNVYSPTPPASSVLSPSSRVASPTSFSVLSTPGVDGGRFVSSRSKRATVMGVTGWDSSTLPGATPATPLIDTAVPATPVSQVSSPNPMSPSVPQARPRPASISSASTLEPMATGSSTASRTRSVEDTLAEARANALRRLEARKKAQGDISASAPFAPATPVASALPATASALPSGATPGIPAMLPPTSTAPLSTPAFRGETKTEPLTPAQPAAETTTPAKPSPFGNLFTPPSKQTLSTIVDASPPVARVRQAPATVSPATGGAPSARTNVSALASRFAPPPSSFPASAPIPPPTAGGKDKYGSISRSDRRRLGRHLPRIASGGEGWDDGEDTPSSTGHARAPSARAHRKSSLGKSSGLSAALSAENAPPVPNWPDVTADKDESDLTNQSKLQKARSTEVLKPSQTTNQPEEPASVSAPSLREARRRSTYVPVVKKEEIGTIASKPRSEVKGAEMKGLMSAIGGMPTRKADDDDENGVTGMSNRLRLSRLPLPSTSAALAPAPLPSRRLAGTNNWMDRQRHALAAYEYLCHVGEAQQWIEGCLDEELDFGVTEMEEGLRDGVVLAKLARVYEGEGVVKRIWTEAKHRFRQSDNINYFLSFVRNVGMPETFVFELTDLYDKKNIPKVIFCIHVLSHLLARLGRAERIGNLVGQFEFTDEQLAATQKGLQGIAMPNFQQVGHTLAKEASWEPEEEVETEEESWATKLQAIARAHIAAQAWNRKVLLVRSCDAAIVPVQAQVRGMLARMRVSSTQNALDKSLRSVVGLQAMCRGCLARQARQQYKDVAHNPDTVQAVTFMQAVLRTRLARQAIARQQRVIMAEQATFTSLQSHLRGALIRRSRRAHEEKMDDATDYIVGIQAVARGILARRLKQVFVKNAVTLSPAVVSLQAAARARLARKTHQSMQKALAKVEVAGSVGGLQAFLRTRLAKKQTTEQKKKLEFVQPDVIDFQAVARGFLVRKEYREWRDYLVDPHTQGALVFLQSLVRGLNARRRLWNRVAHYHRHMADVVKVQAVWRGRTQRKMYERLITGHGVDVPTIQNYMHLLDDTESDFGDQLRIDTLRKDVVELLRTNQTLETEVGDLDTKIALIINNKMTFEDLARAKRRHGHAQVDEAWVNPVNNDPFAGVHLDRASQRKLELYEHLFFTLQTEPKYLARLFRALVSSGEEADRRLVEGVTLILFGFGHSRREEYLFHKLLQLSVHEEVLRSNSLPELADARFAITSVTTQFVKPTLTPYLQRVLGDHVARVVAARDLDLCTDPVELYHRILNAQESATGVPSNAPRDLMADQVLQVNIDARTMYIQHLQELRALTNFLVQTLVQTTQYMPYTIRLLARECLFALRVKYPDSPDGELWPVVAKTVVLPFILPAIIAPETYGVVDAVDPMQRRNLAAIAGLLDHVANQDYEPAGADRLVRVPLFDYIKAEGKIFGDWILDVAEVDFQLQELLESTSEATPIDITRNDIYGTLSVLLRHQQVLTGKKPTDPIARVLEELEGPPIEYDKSKTTVNLRLTNRLAELRSSDPHQAQLREMEVQAKRHVLAVLRVQTGSDLYDVLLQHPTDVDEMRWVTEVHRDIALEQARRAKHNLPPTPVEQEYQMESIRSLPFHEVKSRAIEFCMRLVDAGRLSRDDKLQALLVSIASDIKEKHRLRQKRKADLRAMSEAYAHLRDKKEGFEEKIKSYHEYIDSAMAALQQKKKAPFMSKQYWHQRGAGKKSRFGSYKYTAAELYERGILLAVQQFSPRQFDRLHVVISSDSVGAFTLEMASAGTDGGPAGLVGREELRMEDLLQAQYDNNVRLDLFDGLAAFNLNTLIHQINKKFYAS
ncbi:iqgap-related protein [Cryptotrichosporon argae]